MTFILMHSIPGNPFATEKNLPQGVYDNLMKHYNLDKPLIVQYGIYLKSIARFDFGPSIQSSSLTVNTYIKSGFPISARLGFQALIIQFFSVCSWESLLPSIITDGRITQQ
jgi:ABC-type dipeptide/oligopeptide/nickel transport system permease component